MTEVTESAGRTKKFMARRFTAPSADAELTPGEDRFARALAMRDGEDAPADLTSKDLAAAYRNAWPGRAKRFRPATVAAKAADLIDAPRIQAAIAHYLAERAGAP
ncbi:MAG: hypothetical protein O7F69_06745, partial [Alphaproteobacteria bacterium]|nr:hypothetical protein [Alphaproteobacteria bacterium]